MKSLLELYGQQFRNPMLDSDSQDYTTADVFGQMGANKRRSEYDNSLLGMVHNWATGEARQPVQLPDNAPLMDQMKEAGMRMLNLPNDMAAGGAKTMAHWLGSAGNPEMVEPLDMLAPLGIGAMAGLAGHLRPSQLVGRAQEFPPVVRGQDGLPSQFDELANVAKEYTAVSSDVDRMRGVTNGQQMQINVANDPSRANDVGSYPIDAYDRAALDRQWRQKVARTGELFSDQSRSSIPGLAANALDMSHEARMARAKEMGFDVDSPVIHYTRSKTPFNEFRKSEPNEAFGPGVYVTTSDEYGAAFGNTKMDLLSRAKTPFLWDTDDIAGNMRRLREVIPDIDEMYSADRASNTRKLGPTDEKYMWKPDEFALRGSGDLNGKIVDRLSAAGFDSIKTVGHNSMLEPETNVFDPKNLRSVNAAFDPSKADSANLLAADQARSSIPGLAANALDMSHEARMARAKETGFDTGRVLYRGLGEDWARPDWVQWFSSDPGVASVYAMENFGSNKNVVPAYGRGRALEVDANGMDFNYIPVTSEMASGIGLRGRAWRDVASPFDGALRVTADDLSEAAKNSGYDRLVVRNVRDGVYGGGGLSDTVAIFDPKNIRSVNAAFDPSKADSANLLAADQARGSIPGLLAGAADEPTQDSELMRLLQQYGMMP